MNSSKKSNPPEGQEVENIDLEKSLKKLEEMVDRLEGGNISLDEAFKIFEEGSELSEKINHKVAKYERKLQILNKQYRIQDFEENSVEKEEG